MPAPFVTTRRIEFRDTDAAGIAHFASFFGYMEEAEHAMLRDLGFSVMEERRDHHLGWPRVSARCQYHAPVQFEDVMTIEAGVLRLGTKSVTYRFRFHMSERLIADGEVVAVCCRVEAGEPPQSVPIPEEIAQRLRTRMLET